jgi:general secretion pathway protein E
MQEWAREAHGIVLVTGPTGSGKSTTLYSMLSAANDGNRKMITVEDPVEFHMPGITQIQAKPDIGYTFARALRAILRQDPDVIMIGEIRDLETAEIAIQAALTGHLVLATLHTNAAASAFTRLINMGIEPFLAAAPVRGLQAQRLVRRLCAHCAEPVPIPETILTELQSIAGWDGRTIWRHARGCAACQNTGYRGRTGIYELIAVHEDLQALVARNSSIDQIKRQIAAAGFRNLRQDGLLKASRGITSLEEVLRVVGH